jgi:tripartite ATP-independent transporter DctM subunit
MEFYFLALLVIFMAAALASGFPVAFALPGSAIMTIAVAAIFGWVFTGSPDSFFAQGGPGQWLSAGVTNLRGVYWEVERDTLIAIPLFIFMGIMLQRSKIAEDLLMTMAQLFGPVRGGLGISVVFVGALLAATTGILGATVVAMGLISLPAMLKNNYSRPLAAGTIAASGTLGQIIPPSIVLIILADQLASATDQASTTRKALYKIATGEISMPSEFDVGTTSAGEMFLGALLPGLVLVGLYMLFILIYAFLRPKAAPAVAFEGEFDRKFAVKVVLALVPPLTLIFLVLGSIITGVATVNQAGAIGAAGALVMAGYRLKEGEPRAFYPAILAFVSLISIWLVLENFDTNVKNIVTSDDVLGVTLAAIATSGLIIALIWSGARALRIGDTLQGVMINTAKTTSLVFIILLGAAMLTAAFRAFGGEELVKEFLGGLPGGFWSKFVVVMAVIFVLGFFLDFIEIAVVVVPIVAPILLADPSANITAVWLGVMIGLNIQTSFLTPPFGFALFYLRGVAPTIVKTIEIYKGVVAFILLQLVALVIVGLNPPLVNYLPNRLALTSVTAPPPRNPKLLYCVEEYIYGEFQSNGNMIRDAIATARGFDMSYLPSNISSAVSASFEESEKAIDLLTQVKEAEAIVAENTPAFRPIHTEVRFIESEIRKLDDEIKEIETDASRLRGEENADAKQVLEQKAETLIAERDILSASIPAEWPERSASFAEIRDAEILLRRQFRRAADSGYEPVVTLMRTFEGTEAYNALEGELEALSDQIASGEAVVLMEQISALASKFSDIEGASDVRSGLSKVRRALRGENPDTAKAAVEMLKVFMEYRGQLSWRERASQELAGNIASYETIIRGTIGARLQTRLNNEQALFVAACGADHRDISLNF